MKISILGCSGGIGGALRTTSMLLDDDVLIDAGTGVGDLDFEAMSRIDHVFITHAHLDHIACLPLLIDSVARHRDKPITVHALEATVDSLKRHIFNWEIWPDFTRIPDVERPFMRYQAIGVGDSVDLDGRKITALQANHTVPALGYHFDSGEGSLVFSGDTTVNDIFWNAINKIGNLRYLIIETAFSDHDHPIAVASKHLCPSMLEDELRKMVVAPEVFITHLKPGDSDVTMREVEARAAAHQPRMLMNGAVFEI